MQFVSLDTAQRAAQFPESGRCLKPGTAKAGRRGHGHGTSSSHARVCMCHVEGELRQQHRWRGSLSHAASMLGRPIPRDDPTADGCRVVHPLLCSSEHCSRRHGTAGPVGALSHCRMVRQPLRAEACGDGTAAAAHDVEIRYLAAPCAEWIHRGGWQLAICGAADDPLETLTTVAALSVRVGRRAVQRPRRREKDQGARRVTVDETG